MFNKKLFENIINCDIKYEDLEAFSTNLAKQEYDLKEPFDRYYNVSNIINAINKCKNNEISLKFLAHWANAYNWILMGGFKGPQAAEFDFSDLKSTLQNQLSEALDSLSFYGDGFRYINLYDEYDWFRNFDKIYSTLDNSRIYTCLVFQNKKNPEDSYGVYYLTVNKTKKQYGLLYKDLTDLDYQQNFNNLISEKELKQTEKALKKEKYEKISIPLID